MGQQLAGYLATLRPRIILLLAVMMAAVGALAQDAVPGRLLVKFREGSESAGARMMLVAAQAQIVDEVPQLGIKAIKLPAGTSPQSMARSLVQAGGVMFAEPDYILKPAQFVPNDPMYSTNQQTYFNKVSAPNAWAINPGSPSVIVAVCDTGVDGSHADLIGNLVPGRNVYSDNNDTSDLFGHGTQTAGTIAAVGNNGVGVASMAFGCKVMPIRICSSTSSSASTLTMLKGVTWAADNGARVANISYTGAGSSAISNAAAYMVSKGGVMTMSAGNQSMALTFPEPADYLVVGATEWNDTLSGYSNYGTAISLVAPGTVYTVSKGGGYGYASGTSFSSPMAAGVLALMKSANPTLTPARLYELIKQNCDDLGSPGRDDTFGAGRINAYAAVRAAANDGGDTTPPAVNFSSPANGATVSGTVTVLVTASDADSGMESVSLSVDGSLLSTKSTAPYQWSWNTTGFANGNHTLLATARDAAGNQATRTITVNVNNADTTPPTVSFTSPANGATVSGTVTVSVSASDSGSGMQSVSLSVDGSSIGTLTASPYTWSWNTASLSNGSHTLLATARDVAGNTSTSSISVTVNQADTTPPDASFVNPSYGQTVSGIVTVQVSASDSGSGMQSVRLVIDGVSQGTLTSAPYNWSWNTNGIANGNHGMALYATDVAGNTTVKAINVTVNNGDTTPPTANFTNPLNGQTVSGTVSVVVSASDSGSGMQSVSLSIDGSSVGTLSNAPYSWSWNTTGVANGSHTLLATARDVAGNITTKSISVNVNNADTTPPTVNFTSPANGANVSGTVNVSVSASDSGSGMQSVSLTIDGNAIGTLTSAPYAWAWNTAAYGSGSHTLVATARDVAGNIATKTITVQVNASDNTPPSIAITNPTGGYMGRWLDVQVAASDNVGVTRVELYFDGQLVAVSTSGPFDMKFDGRAAKRGNHSIQCKAFDAAGNFAWSQVVSVRR